MLFFTENIVENAKFSNISKKDFKNANELKLKLKELKFQFPWSIILLYIYLFCIFLFYSFFELVLKTDLACGLPESHFMAIVHSIEEAIEWIEKNNENQLIIQVCFC